jgi:uncharacterized protein (TIRG00374 family)
MMKDFWSGLANRRGLQFFRRHLSTLIKVSITLAGLAYVLTTIPLNEIRKELHIESWSWVVVAFILVLVGMFVRAFRWRLLLRGLNAQVRYLRLVELYFAGTFFNTFLPSGFGGDAVRIIEVAKDVPTSIAAGTVIVDRLTGIMALLLLALLAMPFRPPDFPDELALIIAAISLVGLMGGFILLEGSLITRLGGWLPARLSTEGEGPVAKLMQAVQGCGWKAIAGAFGVSMIFNLLLISWWVAAAKALGEDVSYGYMTLVVPIMSLALLVPSISGIGVRESIAGPLFAAAGLAGSTAVVLSLLVRVITLAVSLIGAPIYLLSTIRESRQAKQRSQKQDLR